MVKFCVQQVRSLAEYLNVTMADITEAFGFVYIGIVVIIG